MWTVLKDMVWWNSRASSLKEVGIFLLSKCVRINWWSPVIGTQAMIEKVKLIIMQWEHLGIRPLFCFILFFKQHYLSFETDDTFLIKHKPGNCARHFINIFSDLKVFKSLYFYKIWGTNVWIPRWKGGVGGLGRLGSTCTHFWCYI